MSAAPVLRALLQRPGRQTEPGFAGRRLLVISPHCDDAVLSLGAALSAQIRGGGRATVLTLLAGDTTLVGEPGPWDRSAGFACAADAARTRQDEDRAACRVLGVDCVQIPEVDEQYPRSRSGPELAQEVLRRLTDHDEVLVPGHPLRHPDHRFITQAVFAAVAGRVTVRAYAEEPYASRTRSHPGEDGTDWQALPARAIDLRAKARAVACYRSQLGPLGRGLPGRDPSRALLALVLRRARRPGERVSGPLDRLPC